MTQIKPLKKGDVVRINIKYGGKVRRQRNHGRVGIVISSRALHLRVQVPTEYQLMRFDGGAQWFSEMELILVEDGDV